MLFDLKGRRRRVVQGTYLMLAVLMGGGLVLFGIGGGGLNGGLLDAFKGGGGSSNGNSQLEKQIETAQKRLAVNPQDQAALTQIIRGNYQLAGLNVDTNTGTYTSEGKKDLQKAATAWDRYLGTNPAKPDATLANFMFQAYSQAGLNQPAKAEKAAEIVARQQNSSAAYLQVVQYASLAGDTRTADLAAQKALDLAPKGQRSSVQKLLKQARAAGATTQSQSGSGGGG
jgi:tetratricopeptide (TPR) repeat protein